MFQPGALSPLQSGKAVMLQILLQPITQIILVAPAELLPSDHTFRRTAEGGLMDDTGAAGAAEAAVVAIPSEGMDPCMAGVADVLMQTQ